ncbi:TIM barrel protein [Candidatus Bathyarchaeota archaeon]|nr:TIM barrel protein [Candidatus Bathyarchaeota archaeon]
MPSWHRITATIGCMGSDSRRARGEFCSTGITQKIDSCRWTGPRVHKCRWFFNLFHGFEIPAVHPRECIRRCRVDTSMDQMISVITDEFGEPDFEKIATYLSSSDFEYVELRSVWIKNVFHLDEVDIGELKDILNDTGLKVSSISGGLMKTTWPGPSNEPEYQETMEDGSPIIEYQLRMADNCVRIADALGAPFIRAFGFHRMAIFEEEMWPDWLEAMQAIVEKAKARDKTIIIENEHGCTVSGVDSIEQAFKTLHSDHCKLLLDPGNLLAAQELYTDEIHERLKDYVGYVHVKDAIITSRDPWQTKWCIIGQGEVGWKGIIKRFIDDGYDSFWSVETHMGKENRWENTVKNLAELRDMFL